MYIKLPKDSSVYGIFALLESAGFEARIVGGFVRDSLLGFPCSDLDIATTATPDVVVKILQSSGYKIRLTGLQYGTITALFKGETFEITSLRSDIKTYGRKATVSYTTDWRLDAERRDFTINALYADKTGKIYDFVGGLQDIRHKILRFVGNATVRVQEDVLRILRYYRLQAQLHFKTFDRKSLQACTCCAKYLNILPAERIYREMKMLLSVPFDIVPILTKMQKSGVLPCILPFPIERISSLFLFPVSESCDHIVKMVALAQGSISDAQKLALSWKIPKREASEILHSITVYNSGKFTPHSAYSFAYFYGKEATVRASLLKQAQGLKDYSSIYRLLQCWQKPAFPLCGRDLQRLGVKQGPALGKLLKTTEVWWVNNAFTPELQDCLLFAKRLSGN